MWKFLRALERVNLSGIFQPDDSSYDEILNGLPPDN